MEVDDQASLFDDEDVPGISYPGMGISYPGTSPSSPPDGEDGVRTWGADWSRKRGVTAVDPFGFKWHCRTLDELIRDISRDKRPGSKRLVCESTFESYDLDQRQRAIDLAASRGVEFLTVPARGNGRRRAAAGLSKKTSQSKQVDYEDARAIQYAAVNGAHLKVPAIVDEAWAELREEARRQFIRLRRDGQKEKYAEDLLSERRVPPFRQQPAERRIALGKKGDYSLVIVAVIGVAAEFVSNRADFERLTGLYGHGYPSQFRSDLMHWGWGMQPKKQRIGLSAYRRELRWLFHQIQSPSR